MVKITEKFWSAGSACPVCGSLRVFLCRRRRPIGGPKYTIVCFACGRRVREYRHKDTALHVFFRSGAA